MGSGKPALDGSLPGGRDIAGQFGRHERWGRLVKRAGIAGELSVGGAHDRYRGEARDVRAAAMM
jgi:hypothetical protein